MKFLLILTVFIYSTDAQIQYVSSDLEPLSGEIVNAINTLALTWKAGKNFNGNTSIEINDLISNETEEYYDDFEMFDYASFANDRNYYYNDGVSPPETFDARKVWPNCPSIGKIYTQKKGYPSWIYVAVGSIADRLCIKNGTKIDVEATVERFMRSNGGLEGKNMGQVFKYWADKGIAAVKSSQNTSYTPLSDQSNDVQFDYYNLTVQTSRNCRQKKIDVMEKGPFAAYLQVYSDFPSYKSGVYQRRSEKLLGMHYVKLIGWGIENDRTYWLATNSWGSDWGDNGVFKIDYCTGQFGVTPKDPAVYLITYTEVGIPASIDEHQIFDKAQV